MTLACVYRPPKGDPKKCIDKISEIMSRRENFKMELWFLGDFNVDFRNRNDTNRKRFIDIFKTYGLKQLIVDITRPSFGSGTCIDRIITSCRFVKNSYVLNMFMSDHNAV